MAKTKSRVVAPAADQILVLRLGDETWRLAWRNLPLGERMLVRKWTGLPYSHFVAGQETIDQDSLALVWCLARRAAGEKALVFTDELVTEWETRLEAAGPDGFDAVIETPDELAGDDDPEA